MALSMASLSNSGYVSPEYGRPPALNDGYPYTNSNTSPDEGGGGTTTLVERIKSYYERFLGRSPTSSEIANLAQGSGGSEARILQTLMESREYQTRLKSLLSSWYQQYLGRDVTSAEFQSHLGNPDGPDAIQQTIASSPEATAYTQQQGQTPLPTGEGPNPITPTVPKPGTSSSGTKRVWRGWDQGKLADLTHNTIKYQVGRILQNYDGTAAGLLAAKDELAKIGVSLVPGGKGDKIKLPSGEIVDVVLGGDQGFWWGSDVEQAANVAATGNAGTGSTSASLASLANPTVPTTATSVSPNVTTTPAIAQVANPYGFVSPNFAPTPVMSQTAYAELAQPQAPNVAQPVSPVQPMSELARFQRRRV